MSTTQRRCANSWRSFCLSCAFTPGIPSPLAARPCLSFSRRPGYIGPLCSLVPCGPIVSSTVLSLGFLWGIFFPKAEGNRSPWETARWVSPQTPEPGRLRLNTATGNCATLGCSRNLALCASVSSFVKWVLWTECLCSSRHSYGEALNPSVAVFGDGASKEVNIQVKGGHKGGALVQQD